jgi:hypothetical protein
MLIFRGETKRNEPCCIQEFQKELTKYYSVASVTKRFTLKGVQTIHRFL